MLTKTVNKQMEIVERNIYTLLKSELFAEKIWQIGEKQMENGVWYE